MAADAVWLGRYGAFDWLVCYSALRPLAELTVRFHPGHRLSITACDGGPIRPGPEEGAAGWEARGDLMVSPPLDEGLDVPRDDFDEWYVLDRPPHQGWRPEVFVNIGGFTLVPIEQLSRDRDPTWDRHGLDWLEPIQERFWEQLGRLDPVSYVASGDLDIVVSRRREFFERLVGEVVRLE